MSTLIETWELDALGRRVIPKDPNAELDYSSDWSEWLAAQGDTATDCEVILGDASTLTIEQVIRTGGLISAMISGGAIGELEPVTFRIITATRRDDRTGYLQILQR